MIAFSQQLQLSPLPEPNNEYQQHELKIVIDADGVEVSQFRIIRVKFKGTNRGLMSGTLLALLL